MSLDNGIPSIHTITASYTSLQTGKDKPDIVTLFEAALKEADMTSSQKLVQMGEMFVIVNPDSCIADLCEKYFLQRSLDRLIRELRDMKKLCSGRDGR